MIKIVQNTKSNAHFSEKDFLLGIIRGGWSRHRQRKLNNFQIKELISILKPEFDHENTKKEFVRRINLTFQDWTYKGKEYPKVFSDANEEFPDAIPDNDGECLRISPDKKENTKKLLAKPSAKKISTATKQQMLDLADKARTLNKVIINIGPEGRRAISEAAGDRGNKNTLFSEKFLTHLLCLESLNAFTPKTKSGSDNTYQTMLIEILGAIYQDFKKEVPKRTYSRNTGKESGVFLDFVRKFFSFLDEEMLRDLSITKTMLSESVRNYITDLKVA